MGGSNTKTYQQPYDFGQTYGIKIFLENAEWINNITRELDVLEEGQKNGNTHRLTQINTEKNIKLETARPWWTTWQQVQEVPLHSRQTSSRKEQMPKRDTSTWMDDQRKEYNNPKGPKQKNCCKQLQTDNLPTNHVENTKSQKKKKREKICYSWTSCWLFPD